MDKICKECGTVNEHDYTFCKNCGCALPEDAPSTQQSAYNTYNGYAQSKKAYAAYSYQTSVDCNDIDGIPTDDMVRFVGKNSHTIIPKWVSMQMTHGKVSWCWPVFILTMLFGLCGAAFWHLYRRMYKLGIALLAAALIFGVVQTAVTFESTVSFFSNLLNVAQSYTETLDMQQYQYDIQKLAESGELYTLMLWSFLFNGVQIIFAILLSLFSINTYKNYAVRKIRSYGRPLSETELYLAGGTSGGATAVGAVIYYMISSIISTVWMLIIFSVSFGL